MLTFFVGKNNKTNYIKKQFDILESREGIFHVSYNFLDYKDCYSKQNNYEHLILFQHHTAVNVKIRTLPSPIFTITNQILNLTIPICCNRNIRSMMMVRSCQFYQPFGANHKCSSTRSFEQNMSFSFTNKTVPNFMSTHS